VGRVGTRAATDGENVTAIVRLTGHPARLDSYGADSGEVGGLLKAPGVRSSVGAQIVVEGRLWGVLIASSKRERPLPACTETRIAAFAELVAAAMSNAESRRELTASRARVVAASDEERRRVVRDLHDGARWCTPS
jgi:GAF domain-containing protein